MGFFSRFKKQKPAPSAPVMDTNTAADEIFSSKRKPELPHEQTVVYKWVKNCFEGVREDDDGLWFDEVSLNVKFIRHEIKSIGEGYFADCYFAFKIGDEPMFSEVFNGGGRTADEALEAAAKRLCGDLLAEIFASLGNADKEKCVNRYDGREHIYYSPVVKSLNTFGSPELERFNLYDCVKDILPEFLSREKYTYVKLAATYVGGKSSAAAYINGRLFGELSQPIAEKVNAWEGCGGECAAYQYMLFVQDDETLTKPRHKTEDIAKLVEKTAEILSKRHDRETSLAAYEQVKELCGGDEYLTWEMMMYLPDIFAMLIIPEQPSIDEIVLKFGGKDLSLKPCQLTAWDGITLGAVDFFGDKKPEKEFLIPIVAGSAFFKAYCEERKKGTEIPQGFAAKTVFSPIDGYEIY